MRHVAIDAHRSRGARLVMMMRRHIVFAGGMLVTRCARLVARMFQLQRMRIMAIGAADALVVHLALNERTVDVDFVLDLSVGVIGVGIQ